MENKIKTTWTDHAFAYSAFVVGVFISAIGSYKMGGTLVGISLFLYLGIILLHLDL